MTTPTVRKLTLDGHEHDTFATEAELNGWRATQATLFDRHACIEAVVLHARMPACPECGGVQRHKLAPRCSRIGKGYAIDPLPADFPGIYNRTTDTYDMPAPQAPKEQGKLI
jgi:hypothetical protein